MHKLQRIGDSMFSYRVVFGELATSAPSWRTRGYLSRALGHGATVIPVVKRDPGHVAAVLAGCAAFGVPFPKSSQEWHEYTSATRRREHWQRSFRRGEQYDDF